MISCVREFRTLHFKAYFATLAALMRKEIMVAVLLGFSIGLLIVFGIITARTALNQQSATPSKIVRSASQTNPDSNESAPHTPTPAASFQLAITEPQDGQVVNSAEIVLRGKTAPLSYVAITTEGNQFIVDADAAGSFSQPITLVGGANELEVTALSPAMEQADARLIVVFTTAEF